MVLNINEAIKKIKEVGLNNARAVPMPGQKAIEGDYQIEVNNGGTWSPIVIGVKKQMAENIISQAVNKVILG